MIMTTAIKCHSQLNLRNHLAFWVNIPLNYQEVVFFIGCHEAIITF